MQSFFPSHVAFPESTVWASAPGDLPSVPQLPGNPDIPQNGQSGQDGKEEFRARNRIAAKKWRDKKDETLYQLEATNDQLRKTALDLRRQILGIQTENRVLEEELKFFQAFMTKIMKVTPNQPGILPPKLLSINSAISM
jgi:hypothetical protein